MNEVSGARRASGPARAKRDNGWNVAARGWAWGMLSTLLVQFGIGMYVNLFANIPLNHPGHDPGNFITGSFDSVGWAESSKNAPVILATHAGVGLILVVGAVWMAVLAIRGRRPAVTWASIGGAVCILGAAINGASFLAYNKNINSYVMALLTGAALLCYVAILALPARASAS